MSNLTRPMTHLLDFKMAPKNVYFIIKLWSTYCILQTALLKVVQVHRGNQGTRNQGLEVG